MLAETGICKIIDNDRSALNSALEALNAGSGKVGCRYLWLLANHHLKQGFQKARFPGLALAVNETEYRIRQPVLIIASRHIPHVSAFFAPRFLGK